MWGDPTSVGIIPSAHVSFRARLLHVYVFPPILLRYISILRVVEWRSVHGRFLDCMIQVWPESATREARFLVAQKSRRLRQPTPKFEFCTWAQPAGSQGHYSLASGQRHYSLVCGRLFPVSKSGIFMGATPKIPTVTAELPPWRFPTFLSFLVLRLRCVWLHRH